MSATLTDLKKSGTVDQNSVWLDAKNAAEYLGVSRRTLRRWLIEGAIPKDAHKYTDTHRGSQNFFKAEALSKIKQDRSFGSLDQLGTILKEVEKRGDVQPLEFFNLIDKYQPQIDSLNKAIAMEKTKNTAKTTILCFLVPMFIIACVILYFQYRNYNMQAKQLQEKEQTVVNLQAENKFFELKTNEAEKQNSLLQKQNTLFTKNFLKEKKFNTPFKHNEIPIINIEAAKASENNAAADGMGEGL